MFPNIEDTAPVEVGWTSMSLLTAFCVVWARTGTILLTRTATTARCLTSDAASGSSDAAEDPDETESDEAPTDNIPPSMFS